MPLWEKGKSGNPGGRPKIADGIREMARAACPRAIERAIELLESDDEKVAILAIKVLLDRGIGKPVQALDITDRQATRLLDHLTTEEIVGMLRSHRSRQPPLIDVTPDPEE